MSKVTVHRFTVYDIRTDERRRSSRMATEVAIRRIGGEIVPGTVREIEASELDPEEEGMTPRGYMADIVDRILSGPDKDL